MKDTFTVLEGFYMDILLRMFEYDFKGKEALLKQIDYTTMSTQPDKDGYDIVEFSVTDGPYANVDARAAFDLAAEDEDGARIWAILFVDEGKLHLLDIYKADGSKILSMPPASDFVHPRWAKEDDDTMAARFDHIETLIGPQGPYNKPNLKYPHVYPIVRIDIFQFDVSDTVPIVNDIEQSIRVVSVFDNEQMAEQEVDRLNKLRSDKNVHYFYNIARHKS